jgi:hypothetical protein
MRAHVPGCDEDHCPGWRLAGPVHVWWALSGSSSCAHRSDAAGHRGPVARRRERPDAAGLQPSPVKLSPDQAVAQAGQRLRGKVPHAAAPKQGARYASRMTWSLVTAWDERERCCLVMNGTRCSQRSAIRLSDGALNDYTFLCADHVELVRRPSDMIERIVDIDAIEAAVQDHKK